MVPTRDPIMFERIVHWRATGEGRVMVEFLFERQHRPAAPQRLFNISDGDTPTILQPVRMVSVDTPEKSHYAGSRAAQARPCRQLLEEGAYSEIPDGLRNYLIEFGNLGAPSPRSVASLVGAVRAKNDRLVGRDGSSTARQRPSSHCVSG